MELSAVKQQLLKKLLERETPTRAAGIPRRSSDAELAPLSVQQESLWLAHRLNPNDVSYNHAALLDLRGPLETALVQQAFAAVLERHAILRSRFELGSVGPVMRELPAARESLAVVEASSLADIRDQALAMQTVPFDLEHEGALRCRLFQIAPEHHVLALATYHLVSDHQSKMRFFREVGEAYRALRLNPDRPPLAPLAIQYADYAAWQRQELEKRHSQLLDYWSSELAEAPALIDLTAARTEPNGDLIASETGERQATIPATVARRITDLAASQRASAFSVVLATLYLTLSRFSAQDDLVVGVPFDRRDRAELEPLIGLLVETIPIRFQLTDSMTFSDAVHAVRGALERGQTNGPMPLTDCIARLSPPRCAERAPYANVMVTFLDDRLSKPVDFGAGVDATLENLPLTDAKADLVCTVRAGATDWRVTLEFSHSRVGADVAGRLLDTWLELLHRTPTLGDVPVSQLPLLSRTDHKLLREWNQTGRDYPRDVTIATLFERQCAASPTAIALVSSGKSLTYEQLDRRANRLALELASRGVTSGTCVGICLERSIDQIVAVLAIVKVGGAYVPLDPAYPSDRLAYMVHDCNLSLILSDERGARRHASLNATWLDVTPFARESCEQPTGQVPRIESPDATAYVIYTSGSTGIPKGVEVPHRAIARLLFGVDYVRLGRDCRIAQLATLAFDASTFEIWGALLLGGTLIQVPDEQLDFAKLERLLREQRVNTMWVTAALFNTIIDTRPQTLAGVEQILTGGEALSVAHIRRAREMLGNSVRLVNGYGPTEVTTFTCCSDIPEHLPVGLSSIPIGRPIANTRVYVVDRRGRQLPIGVPGELWVAGDGLARGYRNAQELTSEKFTAAPPDFEEPSGRIYRTGDRVRWLPSGQIEFLGRGDHQVKLRGFRIELGEIEAVLVQHPQVAQAIVLVRSDRATEKQLVAYVLPRGETSLDTGTLRAFLRNKLPEYMLPAVFVPLAAMPLTRNGKVDRERLPAPGDITRSDTATSPAQTTAPRNALEETLAALFRELLGVGEFSRNDGFLDLGGSSLTAIRLVERLDRMFKRRIPPSVLFQSGSIRQLADLLSRPANDQPVTVIPIQPGTAGRRPLIVLPSPGGDVSVSRALIHHLDRSLPVHCLQPRIGAESYPEFPDFESSATRFVEALREFQPHGPYALLGYCFGGMLAFEVARQLQSVGETVELLAVIDTGPAFLGRSRSRATHWETLVNSALNLPWWLRDDAFRTSFVDLWQRGRRKWRNWRTRFGSQATRALGTVQWLNDPDVIAKIPNRNRQLWSTMLRILDEYQPQPSPLSLLFFRARTRSLVDCYPRDLGWRRYATNGVEIVTVSGHHESMQEEPHVQAIARELARRLRA